MSWLVVVLEILLMKGTTSGKTQLTLPRGPTGEESNNGGFLVEQTLCSGSSYVNVLVLNTRLSNENQPLTSELINRSPKS